MAGDLFFCWGWGDESFDDFPEGVLGLGGIVSLDEVEGAGAITGGWVMGWEVVKRYGLT